MVPDAFRAALAALAPRLGLLAFVTGRDVRQAAAMVGVDGATYVGLHGFDQMAPDGTVARDPAAEPYVDRVQTMARRVAGLDAGRLGLVVENKGPMLDLHYRRAPDPAATLAVLEAEILGPARALGLAIATGHFLVELRPPEPVSKGTAVLRLLRTGGAAGRAACRDLRRRRPHRLHRLRGACTSGPARRGGTPAATRPRARRPRRRRPHRRDAARGQRRGRRVVAATPGVYEVLTALLEAVRAGSGSHASCSRRQLRRRAARRPGAGLPALEPLRLALLRKASMPSSRSALAKARANRSRSIS